MALRARKRAKNRGKAEHIFEIRNADSDLCPVTLLFLGFVYGILSPGQWAFGMLVWFAALLLLAIVRKRTARKTLLSSAEPAIVLDDRARRRILRGIWMNKVWISVLAVCLPIGVVNGVAHRAWLPTLAGMGMNLLLMHVAIWEIRRRSERSSIRLGNNSITFRGLCQFTP